MGTAPIPKLIWSMGLPMILSMMFQAFYNIVDSYFVSSIPGAGDVSVNALTLSFPVQMLMVAIGVGTGVGVNAILSRKLGAGKKEEANHIAGNAVFLGLCDFAVFFLFGLFGVRLFLQTQTSDPEVLNAAYTYLSICTIYSFGVSLYMIYEKLLQATGRTTAAMAAQLTGAVTNIILDPIMIFGLFGMPAMGVAGAAIATVIGQTVSLVIAMILHYGPHHMLDFKLSYLKPDGKIIKVIYEVGFPAILMQALMSVMTYSVNIIFGGVSASLVTAYGIYYKIQNFVFFAAFGLNNALIPIVAFNYGKRDQTRVKEAIRWGMIDCIAMMAAGTLIMETLGPNIVSIFSLSQETLDMCDTAVRIIAAGYVFAGANIAMQGIFQALGHGMRSLILSLLRLIIFALPLAFLLSRTADPGLTSWFAFPLAEAAAVVFGAAMLRNIKKQIAEI